MSTTSVSDPGVSNSGEPLKLETSAPNGAIGNLASTVAVPAQRRWLEVGLATLVILLFYVKGAATIAAHQAIWSPDCGARLVQIQSILQHWPHWWVSYPAQALDPQHQNSPLYFFEFRHGEHIYVFYSFFFALISAVFFQQFGYAGLAILSVLGGLMTAWATYGIARLLRLRYPVGPMLLVALATPLVIYSVVFWDHSLTTGIAAVCLYLSLRAIATGRTWLWFTAGLVLGGGLWFHEILVPCFPALLVGAWWARRRVAWMPACALLCLGVALLVVPLMLINKTVYGTLMGPHLSNNRLGSSGAILSFLKSPREWGLGAIYTLFAWGDTNPGFTWELKDWITNPGPQFSAEIHASLLMAFPVITWASVGLSGLWRQGWLGLVASLAAFVALGGNSVYVNSHYEWPHSLFLACPFLVLAFAAQWPAARPVDKNAPGPVPDAADTRLLWQVMTLFTVIYTLFNLLKPTLGGTEWGSRHLLVVVPALTLMVWSAVESLLPVSVVEIYSDTHKPQMRPVAFQWKPESLLLLVGMTALLLMSLKLQQHGFEIIDGMHASNHQMAEDIANSPDEVVVSAVWWAAMNAAPVYMKKQILYAGDETHPAPPLFERMRQANVKNYTMLGFDPYNLANFAAPQGYAPIPNTIRATKLHLSLNRFGR